MFNDDPLEKNTVDHIDGNKQNNNAENLRWLSLSDNVKAYYNKIKGEKDYDIVWLYNPQSAALLSNYVYGWIYASRNLLGSLEGCYGRVSVQTKHSHSKTCFRNKGEVMRHSSEADKKRKKKE